MSTFDQIPFSFAEFAENPEPRCPCVLVLDTSGSMAGEPINELNMGLLNLKEELIMDSLAAKRVEIAILTFGPVRLEADFQTADNYHPPSLVANGDTPMGAAVTKAIDMVEKRKDEYKRAGITYYRPWIFLISDGEPTDPTQQWQKAAMEAQNGDDMGKFLFFAVGVAGAKMDVLSDFSSRPPLKLQGLRFRDLFLWLSKSLRSVSYSQVGDKIALPPVSGWAEV